MDRNSQFETEVWCPLGGVLVAEVSAVLVIPVYVLLSYFLILRIGLLS
jgi:hypothetical protein